MSTIYVDQPIVVGDTVDFKLTAKKDSAVWDITGATVTFYLMKPDGTILSPFTATLSSPTLGIAHYQVATTVLSVAGKWQRQWKVVTSGSVVMWSGEIVFRVYGAMG